MSDRPTDTSRRDGAAHTIVVALLVSLVCSTLVATASVLLRPKQLKNEALNMQRNILQVVDLLEEDESIEELFRQIDARVVELASGAYAEHIDAAEYDQHEAAKDPARSIAIPKELDVANVGRRATLANVYLVRGDSNNLQYIILPVYGPGLWSTMYGFIALEPDANTVVGLQFYEHEETPGLGDQVDNMQWRSLWRGKRVYDELDQPAIEVIRGRVTDTRLGQHQVDGLSGATLTGRGVTNLLRYWLGEHGFQPYLERMREGEG